MDASLFIPLSDLSRFVRLEFVHSCFVRNSSKYFSPYNHECLVPVHVQLPAGRDMQPPLALAVPFQDGLVKVGAVHLDPALPVAPGLYAGKIEISGLSFNMLGIRYAMHLFIKRTAAVTAVDVNSFSIVVA